MCQVIAVIKSHVQYLAVCAVNSSVLDWISSVHIDVVVQFYLWFKFYFPLFLGMVMFDNEFETKENSRRVLVKTCCKLLT